MLGDRKMKQKGRLDKMEGSAEQDEAHAAFEKTRGEWLRDKQDAATKLDTLRQLVKDTRFGVDWIYEVAKRIAEQAA